MSDVLVGIRAFGPRSFDYIIPKFVEMHTACIAPYADTFICGDDQGQRLFDALGDADPGRSGQKITFTHETVGSSYAEDVLAVADELSRLEAIEKGYKKLVWQDLDCLYKSPEDFERLIFHDVSAVGALTAARGYADVAIARWFVPDTDGEQVDISDADLLAAMEEAPMSIAHSPGRADRFLPGSELPPLHLIPSGFPGAGALCLRVDDIKDITWDTDPPIPRWYDRVRDGRPNICLQEWFVKEMNEKGRQVYLDTAVRVYHVDEEGVGHRYPGERAPLESLSW